MKIYLILILCASCHLHADIINFEMIGGIPDDMSEDTAWINGDLMNQTLGILIPGDTFIVPNKTFKLMGGIEARGLKSVTIQIDGTLLFSNDVKNWPRQANDDVLECLHFYDIENVTFTSQGVGTLNGQGQRWWGIPGIGYLLRGENRPRLFNVENSKNILVENLLFKDSPYWTFWVHGVDGLEVRHCEISARRTDQDNHNLIDITAFNTDGFDVSGKNVWLHDCKVWDQDDCIAVKDNSENMLFERIEASGVGVTIGSIGCSKVNNITFRDIHMHHTWKGIYMKFRGCGDENGAKISNVLYENIYMDKPEQFSIWIGPAQQTDSSRVCAAHPCSICWPQLADLLPNVAKCEGQSNSKYENITLRNITIADPQFNYGQGVILAAEDTPMENIVFDSVRVIDSQGEEFSKYTSCEGVSSGVALGDTNPIPPCFEDRTDSNVIIEII
jgi:hypothetical protein